MIPRVCVIAQQYSSTALILMCYPSRKEMSGAPYQNITSIFSVFEVA